MIAGIVLAGGQSRRMGRPKALLLAHGVAFLGRCVDSLAKGGCEDVVVVLNSEDPEVGRLACAAGARVVQGAGEASEQIDSLRAGLRELSPDVVAAVVLPVDHPLVAADTVAALVRVHLESRAPIVRAAYRGRHGHPVLFSRACFPDLLEQKAAEGARSVIRHYSGVSRDVEVNDRGVVADIDTPADLLEHLGEES